MEISVFSIQKSRFGNFEEEIDSYIKMSSKYAKINDNIIFNDKIAKAQSIGQKEAHKAYDDIYLSNMRGFCVSLDERGKEFTSKEFAKIFDQNSDIKFFIGGAYGLSEEFKSKSNLVIRLSKLTMAHKIAKLVLFEQIFRGLCIKANHPYHK
ncbi:23S rRNA (pseudouridine(1915)-N(3))-methyltransferase RlmH [Campylobacter pinnipediorum]|uniref:23S rRNA (pseudouridine(1915)-N(3))-methyltransferase RlmH n=1 Tax=Campylobacter pinnipediorum TaxID=1965231 RepID=UPI00084D7DE4|nr:23S rRNA (pseudouridine(1915)-N(3))-methyltransferase RlmH [Campylobacter pinnipediorum]AQW84785.1 SPOUT methyltransferase [Campylobacter pinnipediorum subsp. pinnipediorum]